MWSYRLIQRSPLAEASAWDKKKSKKFPEASSNVDSHQVVTLRDLKKESTPVGSVIANE
jgi:hypothetical protein